MKIFKINKQKLIAFFINQVNNKDINNIILVQGYTKAEKNGNLKTLLKNISMLKIFKLK